MPDMYKMKSLFMMFALAFGFGLAGEGWTRPDGEVELGGALWHHDFAQAQREAKETGKPILLFDMVGRLDEKWC